jgi:translation elongation factor P/translation initiation factor 5A
MINLKSTNNGIMMPLLMSFTPSTKIQEETNPSKYIYNDGKQIVMYDMRTVGTYSLKTSSTKKGNRTEIDKKNAIDDSKSVR